ncbi:MAG: response regulator [Solirubrobacteraceae bacterium]
MTIRVLIADDQPVIRDGPAMLLGLLDDVEIVATAADGIEAVQRACSERPDIVLMDLRMPRMQGAEATREILASLPDTRVLVLTTYAEDEFLFPAEPVTSTPVTAWHQRQRCAGAAGSWPHSDQSGGAARLGRRS